MPYVNTPGSDESLKYESRHVAVVSGEQPAFSRSDANCSLIGKLDSEFLVARGGEDLDLLPTLPSRCKPKALIRTICEKGAAATGDLIDH